MRFEECPLTGGKVMDKQGYFVVREVQDPEGVVLAINAHNTEDGELDSRNCTGLDSCGCPSGH